MSYSSLHEDYIPLLEAASQLACGDRDYASHYREVEVWVETGLSPENAVEIKMRRREEFGGNEIPEWAYPEFFHELDELGWGKSWELVYPEIQQELNKLFQLAADGEITIIALPRAVSTRDHAGHPPIGKRYLPIPAEFFQYNEWTVRPLEHFAIERPFNWATRTGGTANPEWFYPAVALRDVHRLQAKGLGDIASSTTVAFSV